MLPDMTTAQKYHLGLNIPWPTQLDSVWKNFTLGEQWENSGNEASFHRHTPSWKISSQWMSILLDNVN